MLSTLNNAVGLVDYRSSAILSFPLNNETYFLVRYNGMPLILDGATQSSPATVYDSVLLDGGDATKHTITLRLEGGYYTTEVGQSNTTGSAASLVFTCPDDGTKHLYTVEFDGLYYTTVVGQDAVNAIAIPSMLVRCSDDASIHTLQVRLEGIYYVMEIN